MKKIMINIHKQWYTIEAIKEIESNGKNAKIRRKRFKHFSSAISEKEELSYIDSDNWG